MSVLQEMAKQNIKLPSPPGIALRLMEALRNDEFSYAGISGIIQSDPALTARVLTVVNSAFYSLPEKVGNLDRALAIMGVNAVKNVALSFILLDNLAGNADNGFDLNYFWKRSITAAVSSELLAPHVNLGGDDIFISSLLQDTGILVICLSRPNDYLKVLDEKKATGLAVEAIEDRMFGFNHQDVGSEILEKWGLPESIYLPIRYHHRHEQTPDQYRRQAKVLFLSGRVSSLYNDSLSAVKIREIGDILKDSLTMCDSFLNDLIDNVAEQSLKTITSFGMPSGDMRQFTQLLQEANEELFKLNRSYEARLEEISQEKSKTEKLALEQREAINRLWEISFRDELTGLNNRRYLQDFLEGELGRSAHYGSRFSLLLLDIDHFKKVNDTYGHQAGDLVLKAVGTTLQVNTRKCDIVVRYGGEEFIVVLPETGSQDALRIAEQLREAIATTDVAVIDHRVRVTISIGVAVCDMWKAKIAADRLIDAADNALYTAKKSGRNRVCMAMAKLETMEPFAPRVSP
ncbi:MAG: GGDEF domain-containing protein [Desulfuromonadales bacterium]|nr:GGDEF domain-containing protein [Desulfuromonadales bacterium]